MIGHVMRGHLVKIVKSHAVVKMREPVILKPANAHVVPVGLEIIVRINVTLVYSASIVHKNAIVISIIQ